MRDGGRKERKKGRKGRKEETKIETKKDTKKERERKKFPSPPLHSHPLPQIQVSIQFHSFLLEFYHLYTQSSQILHYFASAE